MTALMASRPSKVVQMNTRIDQTLKQQGDFALAQAGLSPSAAVRALWSLAAQHRDDPQALLLVLEPPKAGEAARGEGETPQAQALRELRGDLQDMRGALGIPDDDPLFDKPYAQLREDYLVDRLADKDAHHV